MNQIVCELVSFGNKLKSSERVLEMSQSVSENISAVQPVSVRLVSELQIGTSIFCLTVKQQLKHLTNTRSPPNWSGTTINPSCNWPDITGYN
jgi:hypothetical protein